ncbi:hypothetical protein V6N11_013768 [Hibiscus sabdariffa]|uniref:Uncharacterized protein n=1 Tax=Hibiscus sabdariffa TaxID=183260 RepID=A0ABR2PCY3_9ROSI
MLEELNDCRLSSTSLYSPCCPRQKWTQASTLLHIKYSSGHRSVNIFNTLEKTQSQRGISTPLQICDVIEAEYEAICKFLSTPLGVRKVYEITYLYTLMEYGL